MATGQAIIDVIGSEEIFFLHQCGSRKCGISIPELTPQMFSFNNPPGGLALNAWSGQEEES